MPGAKPVTSASFSPKEMLAEHDDIEIFEPIYQEFQHYISNNHIIIPD